MTDATTDGSDAVTQSMIVRQTTLAEYGINIPPKPDDE